MRLGQHINKLKDKYLPNFHQTTIITKALPHPGRYKTGVLNEIRNSYY